MRKVLTSGGIIFINSNVLLAKKSGKFVIPKGHIEKNETAKEAAVREVLEETGQKARIIGHYGTLVRSSTEDDGEVVSKTIEVFQMILEENTAENNPIISEWAPLDVAINNMLYPEESIFLREHLTP